MRRRLFNIFRFRKRFWIPLALLTFMWLVYVAIPLLFNQVLGVALQGIYLISFMVIQVIAYFAFFFYYLAGRVRTTKVMPGDLDLTWDDYRGQPEIVEKAKAWVSYLKGVDTFEAMGGVHQPGILMVGPPGSGKTYLAKVMASEAGVPFVSVEANSLLGTFIGIGPLKVSRIFSDVRNKAKEYGACVLFIDEIDAIGGARSGMDPQSGSAGLITSAMPVFNTGGAILNTILSEIDGFQDKRPRTWRWSNKLLRWLGFSPLKYATPKVMVVGSTNRPDMLDPALTRPGRLGRRLIVDIPTIEGAKDIAAYYLDRIAHESFLTPERVAMTAVGRPAAFIKFALNDAVISAHIEDYQEVKFRHWQRALAEASMGDKQPLPLSAAERECLAYHEAGHAVVLLAVAEDRLKPVFLTTERYGRALGHMYPVEAVQWQIGKTESMIEAAICIFMGGMAAEKVFLQERHNSGGGDMPSIRALLNQMAYNGMLDAWPDEGEEKELKHAISRKREELWSRTQRILAANATAHDALVAVLVKQKELSEDEIMKVVDGLIVSWDDIQSGVADAETVLPIREKTPRKVPAEALLDSVEASEDQPVKASND